MDNLYGNEFILQLAERASKVIPTNEGDYIKDEILHCGKCNTPKQANISLGNGKFFRPKCMCKCEEKNFNAEQDRIKKEDLYIEKQHIFNTLVYAGIQNKADLQDTFEKDKYPESPKSIMFRKYCNRWEQVKENNIGMIISGTVGTGKTFYANCIANEIRQRYRDLCVTVTTKQITALPTFERAEYIKRFINADLLVIDDLGAERFTETSQEAICDLMDERKKAKKPTIITTNLTMDDLKNAQNIQQQRIFDRINEMCGKNTVLMDGASKRQEMAVDKSKELKNILFD